MHIFPKIDNGLHTSVWFDKWDQNGPLSNCITKRYIYDAKFKSNDKVADLIKEARWKWPSEWFDMFPTLKEIQVPFLNDSPDKAVWISNRGQKKEFTVKEAWKNVRTEYPNVSWHQIVWFSQCTPRHTFIMWLALHGRLQTHDIMAKWNNNITLSCSLCDECNDSVTHLFFQCRYSKKVWNVIKAVINLDQINHEWKDIIEHLQSLNRENNIKSILKKIGVTVCVYMIWNVRNSRAFKNGSKDEETIIRIIKDEIRKKLASLSVKRYVAVKRVFEEWGLNPNYCQGY
ncbi:reverse transcriptase zinc-binding domain-containing protein [Tanacetum coccineum]|uniref:Reverse transcriptase zinc-binding domain-containing protein n=1 Tax=Tanacetum coccineum TaxID=301880 RepID=A0ABQ5H6X7_9ASTR